MLETDKNSKYNILVFQDILHCILGVSPEQPQTVSSYRAKREENKFQLCLLAFASAQFQNGPKNGTRERLLYVTLTHNEH